MCILNQLLHSILPNIPKDISSIISDYARDIRISSININILISKNNRYLQVYKNDEEYLYISDNNIIDKILRYIYYNNIFSTYKIKCYQKIYYNNRIQIQNYFIKKTYISLKDTLYSNLDNKIIKYFFIKNINTCIYKQCKECFNKYIKFLYDFNKNIEKDRKRCCYII